MKRPKSKASHDLETRCIVYGNHKRPHDKPQELKVDIRRGEVIDVGLAQLYAVVHDSEVRLRRSPLIG